MKNIIAYSMEKLYKDLEEADELFLSSGMKDMELYEKRKRTIASTLTNICRSRG